MKFWGDGWPPIPVLYHLFYRYYNTLIGPNYNSNLVTPHDSFTHLSLDGLELSLIIY